MTGWRKRQIEELQMLDDEFNRIERESIARKMAVQYALQKFNKDKVETDEILPSPSNPRPPVGI